jgi:hypothetical protein
MLSRFANPREPLARSADAQTPPHIVGANKEPVKRTKIGVKPVD